jgi:hypothetical protein
MVSLSLKFDGWLSHIGFCGVRCGLRLLLPPLIHVCWNTIGVFVLRVVVG